MPKLGCRERSGPKLNTSVTVCVCVCVCAAPWIPTYSYHFFCQTLIGPNRVRRLGHSSQKKSWSHGILGSNMVKQTASSLSYRTYDQASCHAHHRWRTSAPVILFYVFVLDFLWGLVCFYVCSQKSDGKLLERISQKKSETENTFL